MKIITIILLIIPFWSIGQNNNALIAFDDETTRLRGFKDSTGNVVIEPKFGLFTAATRFHNVIAVSEMKDGKKADSYYLLRNGRKFGRDSLYILDFIYDCESEGFIRFIDPETELIGMFDSLGQVAIPAEYSYMYIVRNGMFVGVKNARKEPLNHGNEGGCNHFKWVDGKSYLVNTNNEIQVEGFEYNDDLDWYSLQISDTIISDTKRVSFKNTEGKFISFIDNKLEFEYYLDTLLTDLTSEKILDNSFANIVFYDSTGWTSLPKHEYYKKNNDKVIHSLKSINKSNFKYHISILDFIPLPEHLDYILENRIDKFGRRNKGKYPIYSLIVSKIGEKGQCLSQNHFHFMKFDEKIELISVTLRDE